MSNDRNSPASFDRKPIIVILLFSQARFLGTNLSDSVSALLQKEKKKAVAI